MASAELRGELALKGGAGHLSDAVLPDRPGAGAVSVGIEARRGAAKHQTLDVLRRFAGEPHSDHPPDDEATEGETLRPDAIQEREHVVTEIVQGVGSGRDGESPCSR
jgi:hypothetical protein